MTELQPEPNNLPSFGDLQHRYPAHIDAAMRLTENLRLETRENRALAATVIGVALLLRPHLKPPRPDDIQSWSLLQNTGGASYNPYKQIDRVGADVFHQITRTSGFENNTAVFIEEDGLWTGLDGQTISPGLTPERMVIFDPVDGTSAIGRPDNLYGLPQFTQASQIVLTDGGGKFLFGAISSLVDDRLLLVEPGKTHLLALYANRPSYGITPITSQQSPSAPATISGIALLDRRMNLLPPDFLDNVGIETDHQSIPRHPDRIYPSFGGEAYLNLEFGYKPGRPGLKIQALVDPKGQYPHEAVILGAIAQAAGHTVTDWDGQSVDFAKQTVAFYRKGREDDGDRIQLIIAKGPHISQILTQALTQVPLAV